MLFNSTDLSILPVMEQIESIEKLRKQLIFRSWHRGTKEMDLLMGTFADRNLDGFAMAELEIYEQLLEYSDPDLYNWMTQREETPDNVKSPIMDLLCQHSFVS